MNKLEITNRTNSNILIKTFMTANITRGNQPLEVEELSNIFKPNDGCFIYSPSNSIMPETHI